MGGKILLAHRFGSAVLVADPEGCAMQVDVIDNVDALSALKSDWEAVYAVDPEAHFFVSWTWMSKWLRELSSAWVVLAVRPDGEG